MCTSHNHTYIHAYMYICVCIYMEREREERERNHSSNKEDCTQVINYCLLNFKQKSKVRNFPYRRITRGFYFPV